MFARESHLMPARKKTQIKIKKKKNYSKPQEAIDQLITSNKGSGTEAGQSKQNINLTESEQKASVQSNNRRSNASGYSWWKWRRSTDSAEKILPQKNLDQRDTKLNHQISENTEENSNENSVKIMTQNVQTMETEEFQLNGTVDFTSRNVGIENHDNVDSAIKNDDSISSELADVTKVNFSSEKYRKTLRLTSEQIVSVSLFTVQPADPVHFNSIYIYIYLFIHSFHHHFFRTIVGKP